MTHRPNVNEVGQTPQPIDQLLGYVRTPNISTRWPLLSTEDISQAGSDSELLAIRIVERYGISLDWAVREVADWSGWNTLRPVT